MASLPNEPPFLPPRRPKSASSMDSRRWSRPATPPYLPPRRPVSTASSIRGPIIPVSQLEDMRCLPQAYATPRPGTASTIATRVPTGYSQSQAIAGALQRLEGIEPVDEDAILPAPLRSQTPITRHSSLRYDRSYYRSHPSSAANSIFESPLEHRRPQSHPPSRSGSIPDLCHSPDEMAPIPAIPPHMQANDPWRLPALEQPSISRSSSQHSRMTTRPKPRASISRYASRDSFRSYREDCRQWKHESREQSAGAEDPNGNSLDREATIRSEGETVNNNRDTIEIKRMGDPPVSGAPTPQSATPAQSLNDERSKSRFRHLSDEIGFCFTIAMTQLLAEYLISGFALELPKIMARHTQSTSNTPGDMGEFWPASLLSLILSATLLIFARISDMFGGYFPFMFGTLWLGIWTLIAGFAGAGVLLDVARAMQGLAIAAFVPSTFAMVGHTYPEGGKRKNVVLGFYAGCAPVGFFAGFLVAGALPEEANGWYFWIAAALSFITTITAYLTVPQDRTDRKEMDLKMDWCGAILITAGLILVAYALAVEPYAAAGTSGSGWTTAMVLAPLICGLGCLAVAFWVEGWSAYSPLLPFDFFKKKSVKELSLACLFFYASYGVWLYESAQFLQSPELTGTPDGIQGVTLAVWYTPTAVGGLLLCSLGGAILDIVPVMLLFFISAVAWIAAPLLLALCPLPMNYWAFVMPSMLCATIGIDLTYTVSLVFLSAVQPQKYQGLAGAVASILINLAMSFSLSISEIVAKKAESDVVVPDLGTPGFEEASFRKIAWPFQAAFIYAAVSAGVGLVIAVCFVRISRSVIVGKPAEVVDIEQPPSSPSEASTLVGNEDHDN